MPSPFPGMDPYLEHPSLWPDVHNSLIMAIRELLAPVLRPAYFCQIEERVYITDEFEASSDLIIPDNAISSSPLDHGNKTQSSSVMVLDEPIPVINVIDAEIHEPYLQIIDAASQQIVTVIEVLSPSNKIAGSAGLASYREKRRQILHSDANWIEIDFLRTGVRIPIAGRYINSDYRIHWSRAAERPREWVQCIALEQRLPIIPIPLRVGETEPKLDLQAVLTLIYERAGYEVILDYSSEPALPFTETQRQWAKNILAHRPAS